MLVSGPASLAKVGTNLLPRDFSIRVAIVSIEHDGIEKTSIFSISTRGQRNGRRVLVSSNRYSYLYFYEFSASGSFLGRNNATSERSKFYSKIIPWKYFQIFH